MAGSGHWNTCVNRLYYACFYAVTALLLQNDLSATRHTRVRSALNREFVRAGLVPIDLGNLYNDLFEHRSEADYVEFVTFTEGQVRPWIEEARRFIRHIRQLLPPMQDTPSSE